MSAILSIVLLIGSLVLPSLAAGATSPNSEKDLLNLFKQYFHERNVDKILSLYYFEGTPEATRTFLAENYKKEVNLKIESIQLENVSNETLNWMNSGYVDSQSGKVVIGNGKLVKQLSLQYDTVSQKTEIKIGGQTLPIGLINGKYVILSVKYAPESFIKKVSVSQLQDLLKIIKTNTAPWPDVIRSAEKLFQKYAQLPDGYQSILQAYKTRERGNLIDYTLYTVSDKWRYESNYKIELTVHKMTGILWGPVEEIPDMPIFDQYMVKEINEESGEKPVIVVNSLQSVGEQKSVSKLKSIAAVADFNSKWTEDILQTLIKNNFKPKGGSDYSGWEIVKINSLVPINCATIDYPNFSVALVYSSLNAENRDKLIRGNRLLWISKYDKKTSKLTELVFAGLSNDYPNDLVNDLQVEAIADINNDGYHDIVMKNAHYAGHNFVVLQFEQTGGFKQIDISGASWD
jgi:hypothetical protein